MAMNFRFLDRDCYPPYSEKYEDVGVRKMDPANPSKFLGNYWSDVDMSPSNVVRDA
jgi:hypothetical protein